MKNPIIKNNKTWIFGDIQQRTSHYNRIICAKSTYSNNQSHSSDSVLEKLHCKFKKITQKQRKFENGKLVKTLIEIKKGDSQYKVNQELKQPKSLKNQYVLQEQCNKIMNQNQEIYKKIVNVKSSIGSKKQWKLRKKQLKSLDKLKANKRLQFLNLDQQFYETYRKIRHRKSISSILKVQPNLPSPFRNNSFSSNRSKFYTEHRSPQNSQKQTAI